MEQNAKKTKKINIKKLKFIKEYSVRYETLAGGCSVAGGCSHWS